MKKRKKENDKTKVHQPHDKLVKKILSNYATAKDVLSLYLPPDVLAITNLNKLQLQRDSFIDDEHRTSAVDLLYKTEMQGDDGYIWLLIEHQRYLDYWMPLRLFRYIGIIWDHIRRTNTKRTLLPLVYPLVIYNGDIPYPHSLTLSDLIAPDSVKPVFRRLFIEPFPLIDLTKIEDNTLRKQAQHNVRGVILLMTLKHIYDRNLQTFFEQVLVSALKELEKAGDSDSVVDVLYYLLSEGRFLENDAFRKVIHREFSQKTEGKLMTIAQQIEQKAKLEGLEQGIEQGKLEVAEHLLSEGLDLPFIKKTTGIDIQKLIALQKKRKSDRH